MNTNTNMQWYEFTERSYFVDAVDSIYSEFRDHYRSLPREEQNQLFERLIDFFLLHVPKNCNISYQGFEFNQIIEHWKDYLVKYLPVDVFEQFYRFAVTGETNADTQSKQEDVLLIIAYLLSPVEIETSRYYKRLNLQILLLEFIVQQYREHVPTIEKKETS